MAERYGMRGTHFDFGVDHAVYRPRAVERSPRAVLFYARAFTPRRAVELGVLALQELLARRPDVEVFFFGDHDARPAAIPYRHLGVLSHEELSRAFSEATVGLSLSMTNYSLLPKEMLACGLPVVELDFPAIRSVFGADGPLDLAPFDPLAVADAIERLLTDDAHWRQRSEAGREFVQGHTWARAAGQVETGLREALREREGAAAVA